MQNEEQFKEVSDQLEGIKQMLLHQARSIKVIEPLWNLDDIASYLKLAKSSVKSHIVSHPSFPKPVDAGGVMGRRWKPSEVIAWAERRSI